MPQIGATIEEMQQLQSTFTRESANVAELTSTVSSQVGSTWWVGPAADRFKGQWDGEFARCSSGCSRHWTPAATRSSSARARSRRRAARRTENRVPLALAQRAERAAVRPLCTSTRSASSARSLWEIQI